MRENIKISATKYTCDKCKKEVLLTPYSAYELDGWINVRINQWSEDFDICKECADGLKNWIADDSH